MKLRASGLEPIGPEMLAATRGLERAVTDAVTRAGRQLQSGLRAETAAALGSRLGAAWRLGVYPKGEPSPSAAAFVYARPRVAPRIIDAYERGGLIRAGSGRWMAIPLEAAARGSRGRRLSPSEWQARTGVRLRLVYNKGGRTARLVAALTTAGRFAKVRRSTRGGRVRTAIQRGGQEVPVFLLIPARRVPRLFNLERHADAGQAALAANLDRALG
jgi:uncharacterized protein DUF6441